MKNLILITIIFQGISCSKEDESERPKQYANLKIRINGHEITGNRMTQENNPLAFRLVFADGSELTIKDKEFTDGAQLTTQSSSLEFWYYSPGGTTYKASASEGSGTMTLMTYIKLYEERRKNPLSPGNSVLFKYYQVKADFSFQCKDNNGKTVDVSGSIDAVVEAV